MKNIFFIVSKRANDFNQLNKSAISLGIETESVLFEDLDVENKSVLAEVRSKFDKYDGVIIRTDPSAIEHLNKRMKLFDLFPSVITKTLNGTTYSRYPEFNKLFQIQKLSSANLPVPRTSESSEDFSYPMVAKYTHGFGGIHVFLIESLEDLQQVKKKYKQNELIFQEVLPIGEDYRIIVLGNKAITGHKKKKTGEFVTNVTSGGSVHPIEDFRRDELFSLSEKVAKLFDCEYAGIDIMYDAKGKPRVLEVNRAAGLNQKQYQVWGFDLSMKIIEYFISKKIYTVS